MRVDLRKEEATNLMASFFAAQTAQFELNQMVAQQQDFIRRHQHRQLEVWEQIRKRLPEIPDVPLDQCDFSNVDRVTFEGYVEVPEPKKAPAKKPAKKKPKKKAKP